MRTIKQIIIASKNKGKLDEFARLFGRDSGIEFIIDERFEAPKEDEPTYFGNAERKAVAAARQFSGYAIGEDSGIEIGALNWMPGPLSARFAALPEDLRNALIKDPSVELIRRAAELDIAEMPTARENNELILQLLSELPQAGAFPFEARYVAHLVLVDPAGRVIDRVESSSYGVIREHPSGDRGFGHDPIMSLRPFLDRTAAQLSPEEKDFVSHRGRAVRLLWDNLRRPY